VYIEGLLLFLKQLFVENLTEKAKLDF